jgi:thymidylate synthase (FAD)
MSFTQESTRYCNYSKDKFGNELTFIIPCWSELREGSFNDNLGYDYIWQSNINNEDSLVCSNNDGLFMSVLNKSEQNYIELLENGWKPQQARAILPNSLKTELIMTGFVSDWKHFFMLRTASGAHPQAQEIAIPLEEEFKRLGLL